MQQNNKYFSVLFAALLLFQDIHAHLTVNFEENVNERSKRETEGKDLVETDTSKTREKRFWNGVILLTTGVSAGLDIYKQEWGCTHLTPDLDDNVKLIKQKQKVLVEMKDRINLMWVPVEEKERYLDRLDYQFGALVKQITKYDASKYDILTLIDPQILTKFDLVKANIENELDRYNQTKLQDPSYLVAKFYSAETFALQMAFKFGAIAFYLARRIYKGYKQYKAIKQFRRVTTNVMTRARADAVANLAETNPSLKFKIKFWANGKWANFKAKWPRATSVASKIYNTVKLPFTSRNRYWVGTKRVVAKAAKAGLALFTIAYEIWGFMKFDEQCQDNLRRSEKILKNMDQNKENMTRTINSINKLAADLDEEFIKQKKNLTSTDFINLITEVISLGENAENETEVDEMTNAARTIQYYIDNINKTDYKETYNLNSQLIKAFLSINYDLDCLRSKLSIIAAVFQDCLAGVGHMASIYIKAKALEKKKIDKKCITTGYFTYKGIKNVTAESMKLNNASTVCRRNNKQLKKLVCGDWYENIDKAVSANSHNITTDDVDYFIPLCEPGNIATTHVVAICSRKAEKVSSADVTKKYYKFNATKVLDAYDKCNLTSPQQEKICTMKNDGYTSEQVANEFSLYPRDKVDTVYNNCVKPVKVTPTDGKTICSYKKSKLPYTGHMFSHFWDRLINKYDKKTIDAYAEKNCEKKAGDMIEKKDHKISLNYHKSYRGAATTKLEDSDRRDKQGLLARLRKLLWN